MISINYLDGKQILTISKVGDLFSNDSELLKQEYKNLLKIWHPDINHNPIANDVMSHINRLHKEALTLISNGLWEKSNCVFIVDKKNIIRTIDYIIEDKFELGNVYIGDEYVVYELDSENIDFYKNAKVQISNVRFANQQMEKEMSRFLPVNSTFIEGKNSKFYIVIKKTPDVFRLSDLLKCFKDGIPDKHVAWIMSRLSNLTCYLDYLGIAHNGIDIDNCYVSPEFHSVLLYGGWWYTQKQNQKMIGVNTTVFNIMPLAAKNSKLSNIITDLESVKSIGRILVNDKSGIKLSQKVPKGFAEWLRSGSGISAIEEFEKWNKALNNSYGERKFIKLEISKADIYYKRK